MDRRLNIGCGDRIRREAGVEWVNVDIRPLPGVDKVCPADALPFPDSYFHRVAAVHVLEHFPQARAEQIVKEWARVTGRGGELWIAVPDVLKIAGGFVSGKLGHDMTMKYLYGGQGYAENFHQAGFCESSLNALMRDAGLRDIRTWQGDGKDSANSAYSLNLMGVKK